MASAPGEGRGWRVERPQRSWEHLPHSPPSPDSHRTQNQEDVPTTNVQLYPGTVGFRGVEVQGPLARAGRGGRTREGRAAAPETRARRGGISPALSPFPGLTCARPPRRGWGACSRLSRRLLRRCPAAAASSSLLRAPGLGYNHPLLPGAHSRPVRCLPSLAIAPPAAPHTRPHSTPHPVPKATPCLLGLG